MDSESDDDPKCALSDADPDFSEGYVFETDSEVECAPSTSICNRCRSLGVEKCVFRILSPFTRWPPPCYQSNITLTSNMTLRNWIGSRDGATGYFRISLHGAPEMPPSWLMHDMSLHEMVITVDATVDIQWNLNGPEADLGNISISDDDSLPDVIAVRWLLDTLLSKSNGENTGPEERLETVIEKWQSTTKITVTQEIKVSLDPPGELLRQALQICKRRAFDVRKTSQVNMA
ncbi:hypothetical protein BaRGS_00009653 [Batillaria attramentaria]|uniref:Uncharacterized protein n=1 Tax=Batillaria attramentaria TaxID=370345 RepID=A0ABD0LHV8_9CAEN